MGSARAQHACVDPSGRRTCWHAREQTQQTPLFYSQPCTAHATQPARVATAAQPPLHLNARMARLTLMRSRSSDAAKPSSAAGPSPETMSVVSICLRRRTGPRGSHFALTCASADAEGHQRVRQRSAERRWVAAAAGKDTTRYREGLLCFDTCVSVYNSLRSAAPEVMVVSVRRKGQHHQQHARPGHHGVQRGTDVVDPLVVVRFLRAVRTAPQPSQPHALQHVAVAATHGIQRLSPPPQLPGSFSRAASSSTPGRRRWRPALRPAPSAAPRGPPP